MNKYYIKYPKNFIKTTLIKELEGISYKYHYFAFCLIGIGIEFLGKCLDANASWHQTGLSKKHFNAAIIKLLSKYKKYDKKYKLFYCLRSGFAHAFLPKKGIGLTHREEAKIFGQRHLQEIDGKLVLVIEDLYEDFKKACIKVINKQFGKNDKMNKPFLRVQTK